MAGQIRLTPDGIRTCSGEYTIQSKSFQESSATSIKLISNRMGWSFFSSI